MPGLILTAPSRFLETIENVYNLSTQVSNKNISCTIYMAVYLDTRLDTTN